MRLLSCLLFLFACDGSEGGPPGDDLDGDGVSLPYDCDDEDPAIHPDAAERCDGVDNDCDFETDEEPTDGARWYLDQDGDGWGLSGYPRLACAPAEGEVGLPGDCDDLDAEISPSAAERCDGEDDDCDGQIDEPTAEDARDWYPDEDGDGDGADVDPWVACEAPEGYVSNARDCDDGDPDVNEDAEEICDELDNDCDGEIDGEDAADATPWYADLDGDGYGSQEPLVRLDACERPAGYTADRLDCDDGDAQVHPGADEVCDDADQDCDGLVDEDAVDAPSWPPDADGDGYGDPSSPYTRSACSPPEGYAEEATDCDDSSATSSPTSPERCSSDADEDCDGVVDECATQVLLRGAGSVDLAGYALAPAGDLDGDGLADLLVGAYGAGAGGAGAVYALRGPMDEEITADAATLQWAGEPGDLLGEALAGGADLDGDGVNELLIGAPGNGRGGDGAGAAWLSTLDSGGGTPDGARAWLLGEAGDALADGLALGVGPDGVGGLLIGAPGDDGAATDAGAALYFQGAPTGELGVADADALLSGEAADDQAADALLLGPDLDGDGLGDLVAAASHATADDAARAGKVYLLFGPVSGSLSLTDADARLTGGAAGARAGAALLAPGDLDGDGRDDLALSAIYADGEEERAGATYLITSPGTSGVAADLATATLLGERAESRAGWSLGAGDLDGDGRPDLVVGAPFDGSSGEEAGAAFLVHGPLSGEIALSTADARVVPEAAGDQLGRALLVPGDVDGDGLDDLAIGAPLDDAAADRAGAVLLVRGW